MTTRHAMTAVRDRYERLPYPPPETHIEGYRAGRQTIDGCPRHFFPLYWPHETPRGDLDILVAGCGTSQAAKLAVQMPDARIVAIDLSDTSLEHTRRLAAANDATHLELHRLPIEDVATLGRDFDFVLSTGVLHHLEDPDRGLCALRDVLRPGGAMHLMVYAAAGRVGVEMLQQYCRLLAITDAGEELDALGSTLECLEPDHPVAIFAARADDLIDPAGRADALLHPVETTYAVDDVYAWLDRCGIEHMRWFHQAPYLGDCGFPANTPHRDRLAGLPPREQHAAVEVLRGTLITHAFAATRADAPARALGMTPSLDHPGLLDLRPARFPGATVEGVVLRNDGHREADLVLSADALALRLFEAVDGQRSIGDIIAHTGFAEPVVRTWFVRFWQHDLVMLSGS